MIKKMYQLLAIILITLLTTGIYPVSASGTQVQEQYNSSKNIASDGDSVFGPISSAIIKTERESPQYYGSGIIRMWAETDKMGYGTLFYTYFLINPKGEEKQVTGEVPGGKLSFQANNAGLYIIYATVRDPNDNNRKITSERLEFTILPAPVRMKSNEAVAVAEPLKYGQKLSEAILSDYGFYDSIQGKDVEGTVTFNDADSILPVGTHEVGWTFRPDSANYETCSGTVRVTVIQAESGDDSGDSSDDNPGGNPGDNPGGNPGDNPGGNPGDKPGDSSGSKSKPDSTGKVVKNGTSDVAKVPGTVKTTAGTYNVENGFATFKAPNNTTITRLTIPPAIKANGKSVPVTAIAPGAFKGMKNLKKVTIGKNIKTIGARAFYKCKKLNKVIFKTSKLTKKTIGSKAFTGINKKAEVKCPKGKKAAYKKILLKKGMKRTMSFK